MAPTPLLTTVLTPVMAPLLHPELLLVSILALTVVTLMALEVVPQYTIDGLWYVFAQDDAVLDETLKCYLSLWYTNSNVPRPYAVFTAQSTQLNETVEIIENVSVTETNKLRDEYHVPILGRVTLDRDIIGGDYVSYLVIYTCIDGPNGPMSFTRVLTKSPEPLFAVWPKVQEAFNNYNIPYPTMSRLDNKNC
ncbi:hypothetical protein KQX54_008396 [Cotesia glomerata]|uniref:Uncharacterized protein n=1 Tax=Cotesia glomerata TaxID=32391 RepID=A0AAV7IR64_COTGL|nr:hypothetical protein KQX54_008396 [Cotesia glomerata]